MNCDISFVVTIIVTCYRWAPSTGDHLFICDGIFRPPHILSQFNTCHDLVFLSVYRWYMFRWKRQLCWNCFISCMACTDLDFRKHDTGYPRTNV